MSNVLSATDQLTVYTQPKPFVLLTPTHVPPRGIGLIVDPSCWDDTIDTVLQSSDVVAIDFETRGTDPTLVDNYVVGMGLSGDTFNYYLDRQADPDEFDRQLERLVISNNKFIAHNAYFDGQWVFQKYGKHLNWEACTYALYRQLATEGWTGQRWGLKDAMQDLLLWGSANDAGISDWLITHGYVNQSGNPLKHEMWRCPTDILGHYCLLDAEATYLLYTRVLRPVMHRFAALQVYHQRDFLCLIRLLIEQKLHGIEVDRDGLLSAQAEILGELGPMETWLREESDIAPHIRNWEDNKLAEFLRTEPRRYLSLPKLGREPSQFRKDGTPSKVYQKWCEKRDRPPAQSRNWENWEERRVDIVAGRIPRYRFNLRSGDHLRWLFFDAMGLTPLEFTKKGLPKCDTDSMRAFGPGGEALERYHLLHKELSFVTDFLNRTENRNTIHPGFRTPGTVTGRLSGVEPNIQQVPKSRRFLRCLRARSGHVWIDADFSALEPVVCTELSGDAQLMQVFGPDAPPGADIYLHTGVGLPQFRDQIRLAGYDPETLTPEGAAAAKKQCKAIRQICKVIYLSSSYGAGPKKIWKTLQQQGVQITLEEVQDLHSQYWEFYSGIKQYEKGLRQEHHINKGWVYNGIGRPIGVHQDSDRVRDKRKDIVNRCVQSTGHDILIRYIGVLATLLDSERIEWKPIILDLHDEVVIEVPECRGQQTVGIFHEAMLLLNRELRGTIPLKINAMIVRNLAEAKIEG